jgi:hypothetical protein
MLERTQGNHEEMIHSFLTSSYCYIYTYVALIDKILSNEFDVIFFTLKYMCS